MYLPETDFYGQASLLISSANGAGSETISGVNFDIGLNSSGQTLSQTLGWNILDELLILLQYDANQITTSTDLSSSLTGKVTTNTTTSGLSDPILGAKYRLQDSELIIDLLFQYSLGMESSERVSNNQEVIQTNKEGGSDITLGAEVGSKMGDLQWASKLLFTRSMEKETIETEDGATTTVVSDPYNSFSISGELLYQFLPSHFVRLEGSLGMVG